MSGDEKSNDTNVGELYNELHLSVEIGDETAAIDLLRKQKELIEYSAPNSGDTVLHHACSRDLLKLVQFLVKNGANVNAQNNTGSTPLHKAVMTGRIRLVNFLIDNGADLTISNKVGLLPEYLVRSPRLLKALLGEDYAEEKMDIPKDALGYVIGEGGSRFHEIESSTHTFLKKKDESCILITGRKSAVNAARKAIKKLLKERNMDPFDLDDGTKGGFLVKVPVAKDMHGSVIGKKHATKDAIESEYEVELFVPPPNHASEDIRIRGPDMDNVQNAVVHVLKVVEEARKRRATHLSRPRGGKNRGRGGKNRGRNRGGQNGGGNQGRKEDSKNSRGNQGRRNNGRGRGKGKGGKRAGGKSDSSKNESETQAGPSEKKTQDQGGKEKPSKKEGTDDSSTNTPTPAVPSTLSN